MICSEAREGGGLAGGVEEGGRLWVPGVVRGVPERCGFIVRSCLQCWVTPVKVIFACP